MMGEKYSNLGKVHSIYFGGGTPSVIPPIQYGKIFEALYRSFTVMPDVEISLEANPGTADQQQFILLKSFGVNRISLGAQSFNEKELKLLGRIHNPGDIKSAFQNARIAGFSNLNLDLIFGLPNQSVETWKKTLIQAVKLIPEHLSLYGLTIEENTPLSQSIMNGLIDKPDPDFAADMYELSCKILNENGFEQYEISNWAKQVHPIDRYQCKHNLQYWHNQPYLGFGAASHSFFGHMRSVNVCEIEEYVRLMELAKSPANGCSPAMVEKQTLSQWDEIEETMMVGLRLTREGVDNSKFNERFGKAIDTCFHSQIGSLIKEGLLEWIGQENQAIRLTEKGRLLGNRVFREFVGNKPVAE